MLEWMRYFAVRVRVKECDTNLVQGPYSRTSVNDSSPGTANITIKVQAPIYTQQ
jgi:ssDNA-binding replication factor A large subunit